MTFYANDVHPVPPDHRCADDCDDQLPLIAAVGRGLAGDDARIRIADPDTCNETHLEGGHFDSASGEWRSEWVSENINGGELKYQYNLRPYTVPRTFTVTFIYKRPGRHEWSWTTPAIPYIWTVDNEDGTVSEKPDHIVGTGVATLFVKTMHDAAWNERLHYPVDPDTGMPYPREDFNAPEAEDAWSATLRFGFGGDVEVPDFDDLAKVIGVSKEYVYDILQDNSVTINGIDARNLVDYIDKCDRRDRDHFHEDLGFNSEGHGENSFGGHQTVKAYIDAKIEELTNVVNNMKAGIGSLIYGATVDADGTIHIPAGTKIPTGNINLFSGDANNYIRTRAGEQNNDLKGV